MRNLKQILTGVSASVAVVGGSAFLVAKQNFGIVNKQPTELKAAWTNSYEPSVKWDFNWDRRDASSAIKRARRSSSSSEKKEDIVLAEKNKAEDEGKKSKDDSEVNKKSTRASRHLLLIRHGQYKINAEKAADMWLTELGREQAKMTGQRLDEINLSKFKFTHLHHSTMPRACETADLICEQLKSNKDLPVSVDPLLCEGAPIPPEPPVGHWRPEANQFFTDGSRIEAAFRKYFYRAPPEQLEDSYEIVVCHANVIRYFFCRALQFPAEAWLRFDLPHGSITHIVMRPDGRVSCKGVGEAGFQPINKVTSS